MSNENWIKTFKFKGPTQLEMWRKARILELSFNGIAGKSIGMLTKCKSVKAKAAVI